MPRRVPQHVTGDRAIAALQSYFSDLGWTFESVEKDYGLDAKVEVFENDQARAFIFFVQSKGTEVNIKNTRSVSQYFEEEEVNYFIEVNVPVLVVRYSTADQILFAKWTYSALSFNKTKSRYKLLFSTRDVLSEANIDAFIKSAKYIEAISKFSRGGNLSIGFSGDIADTLIYSRFCREWFGVFGIPIQIDEGSPLNFIITKNSLSLYTFGIVDEPRKNSISNFLDILEIVSLGINAKLAYQIRLLKLISTPNFKNEDIIELANNFRKDIDYLSILNRVREDLEGFSDSFKPLTSLLQLRYFDLTQEAKNKLRELRKNKYTATRGSDDFLNYLLILQTEGSSGEISELLEKLLPEDKFFANNERLAIEFANFAYKSGNMEEALRIISLCSSDDEDIIYLKARLLIQLGYYNDSMLEFQKINKDRKKSTDFLILYTMMSLVVNVFNLRYQPRRKDDTALSSITSGKRALEYITTVDALEPEAWLAFARKESSELPQYNEPEFYSAFSALFSRSPNNFVQAISLFIEKIYYDETADRPILGVTLANLIEEALITFGRRFIDDVLQMLVEMGHPNEVINDIARNIERIEKLHTRINKADISDRGSGFIGNTVYRPSIIGDL